MTHYPAPLRPVLIQVYEVAIDVEKRIEESVQDLLKDGESLEDAHGMVRLAFTIFVVLNLFLAYFAASWAMSFIRPRSSDRERTESEKTKAAVDLNLDSVE